MAGDNIDLDERASLCALNRIFGFEPKIALALIDAFGSGKALFSASEQEISEALGPFSKYKGKIRESAFESAAMELESLKAKGYGFSCLGERGYPPLLAECADSPLGLYFKGESLPEEVFSGDVRKVAVVGTRNITSYGKEWCRRIVEALSTVKDKPLIVSGLAIGVDTVAHKTALDSGLSTVGVMATGIDKVYPVRNKGLADEMSETEGCALVSDYPPGTDAMPLNFIRRNRIIAGICEATILVESKIKGGGMITARLASSYDREVFALPGRVDDPFSQGCNLLIRQNIAEPIGDLSTLSERLGLGKPAKKKEADFLKAVSDKYESEMDEAGLSLIKSIASLVKKRRGISMDEICQEKHLTFSTLSYYVNLLECDGFINVDLLQRCYHNTGQN